MILDAQPCSQTEALEAAERSLTEAVTEAQHFDAMLAERWAWSLALVRSALSDPRWQR